MSHYHNFLLHSFAIAYVVIHIIILIRSYTGENRQHLINLIVNYARRTVSDQYSNPEKDPKKIGDIFYFYGKTVKSGDPVPIYLEM